MQEGTGDAEESLWIAHTANNQAGARGKSLSKLLMSGYSSAGDKTALGTSH